MKGITQLQVHSLEGRIGTELLKSGLTSEEAQRFLGGCSEVVDGVINKVVSRMVDKIRREPIFKTLNYPLSELLDFPVRYDLNIKQMVSELGKYNDFDTTYYPSEKKKPLPNTIKHYLFMKSYTGPDGADVPNEKILELFQDRGLMHDDIHELYALIKKHYDALMDVAIRKGIGAIIVAGEYSRFDCPGGFYVTRFDLQLKTFSTGPLSRVWNGANWFLVHK